MIGKVVSHYTILEKIGEGGMGVVYKAHDEALDRVVALKFLPPHLTTDKSEKERFYHEARAASCLNHPNITTVHEVQEHEGEVFLSMEFVEGETLKVLALRTIPPLTQFFEIAIQISDGLAAAHEKGIVHRDIKSDNIMITPKGQVKIMDFGLAKLKGASRLTRANTTLGTAAYMSPEQARGEEVDHRTDIFSAGVVLYELLTGKLPFRGEHEAALLYSVVNEEPMPIARFNEKVTSELERIVAKALAKDPAERYQHVDEMLADLRHERKRLDLAAAGYTSTKVSSTLVQPDALTPAKVPSRGHPAGGEVPGAPPKRRHWYYVVAVAVLAAAIVGIFLFLPSSSPTAANSKTVAVLPFTNMAGDKEEEYFSDGITEDILTQLAKIAEINVISRTSVMQYKGTTKSIREIGKELNAGVILEGSVRHAGDQVRIVAQLIDASTDKHLWAETYDRQYKEIFAIQTEIARNIASALKTRLSPVDMEHLKAPPAPNTAAYNLLLQGRYFANRRDGTNTVKAIDLYQRALTVDSNDARIWVGLSDAYVQLGSIGWEGITNPNARAREAARKAIALDDNSAEGHRALALILLAVDWNWQEADRECKRALELEPGNASTVNQMSYLSASLGRFDEAIAAGQKAIALDPILDRSYFALAFTYHYVNRQRESIALCRKTLELTPQYPCAHSLIALNYLALGRIDSALAEAHLEEEELWRLHALGIVLHAAGRKEEADQALAELIRKSPTNSPFQIAEVYSCRGEVDKALEWLETAYTLHDAGVSQIMGDPRFKRVEHDPRFAAFLKKLKLVE
jgi:TolB-like protein/Flp pilus assembly protein TadD